jgi:2-polyprenyl-3-methyl-5-hydroxy-6-metoxy-1,4-benzoquinol methylase
MNTIKNEEYKNMWNDRYKNNEFAYGKNPNLFFKEWLQKFEPQSILMPADGEGRNGVYAAVLGWQVTSFDLSEEGKTKALSLANENNVTMNYVVGDLEQLEFGKESFDAMALIYAHFDATRKSLFHQKLDKSLKQGGIIILEAFSKNHLKLNSLNPAVGGPRDFDMLYSKEEILSDFKNYEILTLVEEETLLNEGKYHMGKGAVIRFVGQKK